VHRHVCAGMQSAGFQPECVDRLKAGHCQRVNIHPSPAAAAAAASLVHCHDGATAPKLVIGSTVIHLGQAHEGQRPCTHDAGLYGHIQLAPGLGWVCLESKNDVQCV
jgi:hypothetical protein